jgi:hypothetical protein
MALLAGAYNTSPDVIKKVNPLIDGSTPQPVTTLVLLPGVLDPGGLVPLQAFQTPKLTLLPDLLTANKVTEVVYRTYNRFTGDQLLAGQWVILPRTPNFIVTTPLGDPTP